MNLDERINRLETFHKEGRLIRFEWTSEDEGRECACLLAAFSPEVGREEYARACPEAAMPLWLACLTPDIDDEVSLPRWDGFIARYIAVLPKLLRLPPERLARLDYATRAVAVREFRRYRAGTVALAEIDAVLALLDRAARGESVSEEEWDDTRSACGRHNTSCARKACDGGTPTWASARAVPTMAAADQAADDAVTFRFPNGTDMGPERRPVTEEVWDRMTEEFLTLWENACKETQS